MQGNDVVALVWAPHEARTAAFAERLAAELHNVHFLRARQPWLAPFKYPLQWFATWRLLARKRPRIIYVTNSPPVAGLCVMAYCWFTAAQFILDTHPPTMFGKKWGWTLPVQRFTARRALVNVTDQERFAAMFRSWGADVVVLENPPNLASIPAAGDIRADPATVAYVGTFAGDEPIDALLAAAAQLPQVTFRILGDVGLAKREWTSTPLPNVEFTGYLRANDYWHELMRAGAVLVLTEYEHSLAGAAQDALRIGRPLVVSDMPTLRSYFTAGTVHVANTAEGIAQGVRQALADPNLAAEMEALQRATITRWQRDFRKLQDIVSSGAVAVPAVKEA